jgi:hypothetical protein
MAEQSSTEKALSVPYAVEGSIPKTHYILVLPTLVVYSMQ